MFRFPRLTPFVKKVLIAIFGAYVAQILLENWAGVPVYRHLALNTSQLGEHTLWQMFTYVLAAQPTALFAVLIGVIFLWWMLAPFEARFGRKRTWQLCLVATLGAAIPAMLVGESLGNTPPLSGTGPLLLGTIAAFSWSYRGQGQVSFFGVLDMKPVHLIWLVLGFSLLSFLISKQIVFLVADLGAVGAGIALIEWIRRPPSKRRLKRKHRRGDLRIVTGGREDEPKWLN